MQLIVNVKCDLQASSSFASLASQTSHPRRPWQTYPLRRCKPVQGLTLEAGRSDPCEHPWRNGQEMRMGKWMQIERLSLQAFARGRGERRRQHETRHGDLDCGGLDLSTWSASSLFVGKKRARGKDMQFLTGCDNFVIANGPNDFAY